MIIHHAGGLHVGVADGGTGEGEAARFEGLTHGVGFGGARGYLFHRAEVIVPRTVTRELPDVFVEAAEFFLDFQECLSVFDRTVNLQAIADDAGVLQEFFEFGGFVARDFLGVEIIEDFFEMRALE